MNRLLSQYWWFFLLRGLFAVGFGLLALLRPVAAFTGLVLFLGAYMFVDGLFSIIIAINERKTSANWVWLLATGLFGVLIGILTYINPFATATVLLYMVAFWALVIGLAEIALAIRLRKQIRGEGWYIAVGVITILFGLLVFLNPVAGAISLTVVFGSYALIIGGLLIALALRLRRRKDTPIAVREPNK